MENILITANQVLILFLQIAVGYYFYKKKKIAETSLGTMTFLILNVCLPCSIFLTASRLENTPEFWKSFGIAAGVTIIFHFVKIILSIILLKMYDKRISATYQLCTLYGSAAFMGIPLITALFGPDSIVYCSLFSTIETVMLFIHVGIYGGIYNKEGAQKITFQFILKKIFNPVTISLLLGFVFCLGGIEVPGVAASVCSSLGAVVSPIAMIIVGCQLAKVNVVDIVKKVSNYYVGIIRLIAFPLLTMFALLPFRNGLAYPFLCAYVISQATPQGAAVASLCEQNGLSGEDAASVIGLSTFASIITMPIIGSLFITLFS